MRRVWNGMKLVAGTRVELDTGVRGVRSVVSIRFQPVAGAKDQKSSQMSEAITFTCGDSHAARRSPQFP